MTSPKIILRFTRSTLAEANKIKAHEQRTGGDLRHVDPSRTHLNRVLIGSGDPARDIRSRITAIKSENLREEVEALKSKRRHKDADERLAAGLKDPWDDKTTKVITEVMLTASPEFFDPQRTEEFVEVGLKWIQDTFGESVVSASVHLDETSPHLHVQMLPTVVKTSGRRGTQRIISHKTHPAFREAPDQIVGSYERLQDSVGEAFSQIGLERGERRAEAARMADFFSLPPSPKPKNLPPAEWRAQRRAEAILATAEAGAAQMAAEASAKGSQAAADALRTRQDADDAAEATTAVAKARASAILTNARVSASKTREDADAYASAVRTGVEAVAADQVVWRAPTPDKPQPGLRPGPAFPKGKAMGQALADAIKPAWAWVVGFAERFGLAKAQAEAKAQEKAQAVLDAERAQLAQERARVQGERSQVNAARASVESERIKAALDRRSLDAQRADFHYEVREAGPALARAKAEAERQGKRDEAERLAALAASLRRRSPQRERDER